MKLHLGCGRRYIPGWTHVDAVDFPHIQVRHAIDSLPFIESNTVSVIYACHVIEHFCPSEVLRVLHEWHRVLVPGGILRLAAPNFAVIAELYSRTHDLKLIHGPLFGRQDYLYNFHYAVYDQASLTSLLLSAGYKNPKLYDWRETEHADIDDYSQAYYPHMQKDTGLLLSLNMEATK